MIITEQRIPEAIILTLEGTLNYSSRPQFMKVIHHAINAQFPHVIVNLEHIICPDAGTVSILFMAYQVLTLHHRRLSLLSPSPALHSQLQSMKFPRIMPLYESLDAALTPRGYPFTVV